MGIQENRYEKFIQKHAESIGMAENIFRSLSYIIPGKTILYQGFISTMLSRTIC